MIKAICNTHYAGLKGVFDKGDKVVIEIVRETQDTVLSQRKEEYEKLDSMGKPFKGYRWVNDVVRPKGSMKGYTIKSKNGQYYDDHSLYCIIGNKTLSEIFKHQ